MGLFDFGDGAEQASMARNLWSDSALDVPTIEQQQLQLEQYVQQGLITPEQAHAALVGSNGYDSMDLDTDGKQAQLAALGKLQDIGNNGGLDAQDRSKLMHISNEEQTASRGARDAILQNAEARGMGGSGLSMLAQLENAQGAATRASARDTDVAAQGSARALEALQAAGNLGGTINNNQFSQQKAIADSKNEINKFNAANTQQANLANTATNNAAQGANLAAKQNIANQNVELGNKTQQYNKELAQTNFNNSMAKTSKVADAIYKAGAADDQADENARKMVGTGVTAAATLFSDKRVKEDIKHFDAGDFLDSLTGYKYKYKDPSMGQGKQVGVMAQDLEKEVPQMVEDTPRGKMVDYSPEKTTGPVLASLADLHERLRRLEGK